MARAPRTASTLATATASPPPVAPPPADTATREAAPAGDEPPAEVAPETTAEPVIPEGGATAPTPQTGDTPEPAPSAEPVAEPTKSDEPAPSIAEAIYELRTMERDHLDPLRDEVLIRAGEPLRTDGPTPSEWVRAGYAMEHYPPAGYAAKTDADPPSRPAPIERYRIIHHCHLFVDGRPHVLAAGTIVTSMTHDIDAVKGQLPTNIERLPDQEDD